MRFISVANRLKIVVKQAYQEKAVDGSRIPHPGLRARFLNHTFDSVESQKQLGWTDEERVRVERALLGHNSFGNPGMIDGFYLDHSVEGTPGGREAPEYQKVRGNIATATKERCTFFFRAEDGSPEQCPHEAEDGEFCSQHLEIMSSLQDEESSDTVEVTVEDAAAEGAGVD